MQKLSRSLPGSPVALLAVAMCLSLLLGGAPALAAGKAEKELKRGLAASDRGLVVSALDQLSEQNDEKAAKTILKISLSVDALKNFPPKDANAIFAAARGALARMTDAKALKYIYKSLDSNRDQRVRIVLLEVCGVKDDPDAEAAIVARLADKSPTVSGTAARMLGARSTFHALGKAVNGLIDLVEKNEKKRHDPWQDALRSLINITGQEIDVASDWRSWWQGVADTFDPSKKGAHTGMSGTVVREAPKLFGKEILSKKVVFVLDVSGSMAIKDKTSEQGGGRVTPKEAGYGAVPNERMRLYRLKQAMSTAIKQLPSDTKFSIVTFSSQVRSWRPKLIPASAKNKADAVDFTRGMNASGFTWTDVALEDAFKVSDANAIYFFSDGIPQRGKTPQGGPDYIDKGEILEKVRQWNRLRKVKIFTFGFGEADAAFMSLLAQENDGDFTDVR